MPRVASIAGTDRPSPPRFRELRIDLSGGSSVEADGRAGRPAAIFAARSEGGVIRAGRSNLRLRVKLRALLAAAVLAAAWVLVPGCTAEPPDTVPPPARLSLFALGDTGDPQGLFPDLGAQLAVARGLEYEDRRAPVDLMLLLGDNFYAEGLEASEFEERIRENLVHPYCRFADLSGPLSTRVDSVCRRPEEARHPVPILAVLGNHDYNSKESPRLQREALPLYLPNWHAAEGLVETVEVGSGVSVILLESEQVVAGADLAPLQRALREARGPWRLLVTHRPIVVKPDIPYARRLRKALRTAWRPPQLILSGDEHNLQVWQTERPALLHIISGAGSDTRRLGARGEKGQLFAREALGFARLDLVGDEAGDERFVVSMFATDRFALLGRAPQLVARFSVDRSGRVRAEPGVGDEQAR